MEGVNEIKVICRHVLLHVAGTLLVDLLMAMLPATLVQQAAWLPNLTLTSLHFCVYCFHLCWRYLLPYLYAREGCICSGHACCVKR